MQQHTFNNKKKLDVEHTNLRGKQRSLLIYFIKNIGRKKIVRPSEHKSRVFDAAKIEFGLFG